MSSPHIQTIIRLNYQAERLNSASSINMNHGGDDEVNTEISVFASFFHAIGVEKLTTDLGQWMEVLLASSFGKIFSFGLNTLPNVALVIGDLKQLAIVSQAKLEDLGIGNYCHLSAPLFSRQSQRRR